MTEKKPTVWVLYATYLPDFPRPGGQVLDSIHASAESAMVRNEELLKDPLVEQVSVMQREVLNLARKQ